MKKQLMINQLMINIEKNLKDYGFKYVKSKQHHIKKSKEIHQIIHLNFGLDIINTSLNVRFVNLEKELPKNISFYSICGFMLSQLVNTKGAYSLSNVKTHQQLITSIIKDGIPFLEKISNIDYLISILDKDEPNKVGIPKTIKIRLLPILLAYNNRVEEGINKANYYVNNIDVDQTIPQYQEFYKTYMLWVNKKTVPNID